MGAFDVVRADQYVTEHVCLLGPSLPGFVASSGMEVCFYQECQPLVGWLVRWLAASKTAHILRWMTSPIACESSQALVPAPENEAGVWVVEVTARTIGGRFLLKPDSRFNRRAIGVLARACPSGLAAQYLAAAWRGEANPT